MSHRESNGIKGPVKLIKEYNVSFEKKRKKYYLAEVTQYRKDGNFLEYHQISKYNKPFTKIIYR